MPEAMNDARGMMNDNIHSDGATSQPLGIVAPSDNEIRSALAALPADDFAAAASDLLGALGYHSERTLELSGDVDDFSAQFPAANPDTASERVFRDNAQSARLLFQLTDSEIETAAPASLFDADDFDRGNVRSFLFVAIELRGATYPRGQYAAFTREINKRLGQPAVVLFRSAADLLTLAFIHRREHKRDKRRAVLGSVSLIREIDPASPHRAHLDILAELALAARLRWMDTHGARHNFDGLLAAWLDALDTEELNRRFYRDLFAWFTRALSEATFPANEARTLPAEEHVIRLITRLLFVWFIREKGLIAADLFIEARVEKLLQDYDRASGDSYYRAVLQNLFFATLNTDIERRRFARKMNADHRNFSLYRYQEEIADPDALLALFAQTPFINGGLFDCLDSEEAPKQGGYRIDCFSDNANQRRDYSIPNRLFFGPDGLIPLFTRYKFTVEENTPAEREVALDPELLGKVFENLLAAYNPETRATARKQTGSYYTPRPVVDYMVDEALVAALAEKCPPAAGDVDFWRECLRYLLDYEDAFNDAHELFAESEKEGLARAIAGLKILDPAVGSGAFPMGALHKLTLALRRLDPDNRRWEQLQKELAAQRATAAFDTQDQRERAAELQEISDTFERYRDSDFGRKLYLIQNSVYGVDIQTIATQIAKLRFFISLAIEQDPDRNAANFGIKPLPNLETRFVAANTLISLKGERMLTSEKAQDLEHELVKNRERYFHAITRQRKLACRKKDKALREGLAAELQNIGMPADDAQRIARWDPYDQNASADWFDAKYMFGVGDGFDVVIGNPPYVRQEKITALKPMLKKRYACYTGTADLYVYFYERGLEFLNAGGVHIFICSNSWLDVNYGAPLQACLLDNTAEAVICYSEAEREFEGSDINTIVSIIRKGTPDANSCIHFITFGTFIGDPDRNNRRERTRSYSDLKREATRTGKYTGDKWGGKYLRAPDIYWTILEKGKDKLARLGDVAEVRFGIKTGANEFFYLDDEKIGAWGVEEAFLKPVIKSPRQCKSILIDPGQLKSKLFMCPVDKADLGGTAALTYIKWGESQGFHRRPSCRGRARWWDLGGQMSFDWLILRFRDKRNWTPINETPSLLASDVVFTAILHNRNTIKSANAVANSTLAVLISEIYGRVNLGDGLLTTYGPEILRFDFISPDWIDAQIGKDLSQAFEPMRQREILPIFDEIHQPDRRALDALVFDVLNLTQGERDGVYEAVTHLAEARLRKAKSLRVSG